MTYRASALEKIRRGGVGNKPRPVTECRKMLAAPTAGGSEELQEIAAGNQRLGQHAGTVLRQNLSPGQRRRRQRHVGVANRRFGIGDILKLVSLKKML